MSEVGFFRQFPFEARLGGQLQELELVVGTRGTIDPNSGMSVSLVDVDLWTGRSMAGIKAKSFADLAELLKYFWNYLEARLPMAQVQVKQASRLEALYQGSQVEIWKIQSQQIKIEAQDRVIHFAGGKNIQLPASEFKSWAELIQAVQAENWTGEIRDLLNQKIIRLT